MRRVDEDKLSLLVSDTPRDPLSEENQKDKVDGPNGLTPSINADVKKEVLSAWKRLKIPMILIFGLLVASLVLFVVGVVVYATAAKQGEAIVAEMLAAATEFNSDTGGSTLLSASNFSLCSAKSPLMVMSPMADPFYDRVASVAFGIEYTSLVFGLKQMRFGNFSISNTDDEEDEIVDLVFTSYFNGSVPMNTTASVCLWRTEKTKLGSLPAQRRMCKNEGGNPDEELQQCVKYYVMTDACVKMELDQTTWEESGEYGGSGCYYPFDRYGQYKQINYTGPGLKQQYFRSNANSHIPIYVRAHDDPYVLIEDLTSGSLDIDGLNQQTRQDGSHLMMIGGILSAFSVAVGIILFFVRRSIKRNVVIVTMQGRIYLYSRPPVFRYLGIFLVCIGLVAGVGLPLVATWANEFYWVWSAFIGLMTVNLLAPAAVVALIIFWGHINKTRWHAGLRFGLSLLLSIVLLVICALSIAYMIAPQTDPLFAYYGIFFCLVMIPFASMNLVICLRHMIHNKKEDYTMLSKYERGDQRKSNFLSFRATSNGVHMIFLGVIGLLVCFVLTIIFPPIWDIPFEGNYNIFVSPFSLLPDINSATLIPKLYADVVVFYSFIAFIIFMCFAGAFVSGVYKMLHYWIRIRVWKWEMNTSVGELGLVATFTGLTIWWVWFWAFGYDRIAEMTDTYERAARTLGHTTNLFSSLLLFPVTRNSMWVQILGVPFERAVGYHRWLGLFVLISVTGHMVTFWLDWAFVYNAFPRNIITLHNAQHPDNWTIPMMGITWLGVVFMCLFSLNWFRRRRFELFYYSHHFFLVYFICGLLHSWSLWYFLCGGLLLWFVDRLIRFWRGSKVFPLVSMRNYNDNETTEITLQQNNFVFRAGQYAFINIPSISPLEWHPFTISSSPGDDDITFHIKNMGKSSWTARLNQLCQSAHESGLFHSNRLPVVNMDGPYGSPPFFENDATNVVLVGGGIGITPVISIFRDLYQAHVCGTLSKRVQHVVLIWVVRNSGSLEMFREVLHQIAIDTSATKFESILYVTSKGVADTSNSDMTDFRPAPKYGRPSLPQELTRIVHKHGAGTSVMVCGPTPLVAETRNASYALGLQFHEETFEL